MTECNEDTIPMTEEEKALRIEELKSKLKKELLALLSHPLVPKEFKEVFEKENGLWQ